MAFYSILLQLYSVQHAQLEHYMEVNLYKFLVCSCILHYTCMHARRLILNGSLDDAVILGAAPPTFTAIGFVPPEQVVRATPSMRTY